MCVCAFVGGGRVQMGELSFHPIGCVSVHVCVCECVSPVGIAYLIDWSHVCLTVCLGIIWPPRLICPLSL